MFFTPVCHSVHRGGSADTPRADNAPPAQCMLGDTGNKRVVRILLVCILVTVRKRSLRRLCFYTCLSVILFMGGMHGCGGCVVVGGGHAWLWGVCTVAGGACVVVGGMHGSWGACMVAVGGVRGIRRDTVNEQAVRILLECILVYVILFNISR